MREAKSGVALLTALLPFGTQVDAGDRSPAFVPIAAQVRRGKLPPSTLRDYCTFVVSPALKEGFPP